MVKCCNEHNGWNDTWISNCNNSMYVELEERAAEMKEEEEMVRKEEDVKDANTG